MFVWAYEIAQADGYRLRPGDVLDVSDWQEPKLNKQITVAPDADSAGLAAGSRTSINIDAKARASALTAAAQNPIARPLPGEPR